MTRHEAVEEGEKTHTELVLAGRRGWGDSVRQPLLVGDLQHACRGSGMEQMGHMVGAEQKVRGSTQTSQRTSGADAMRVSQRGGNNAPRPLPASVMMSYPE